MYFVPLGLLIKEFDPAFATGTGIDLQRLTWLHFLRDNLLPVTLGNAIGGGLLVALVYWFVYLRDRTGKDAARVGEEAHNVCREAK
jgi:formate transporter